MVSHWDDTAALAGALHSTPDYADLPLENLAPQQVLAMVTAQGLLPDDAPPRDADVLNNTLNSILWHWMRLRSDAACPDAPMQEAG